MTFPPGRARLATRPMPTGSPAPANTIGISDVSRFAATTFDVPAVAMTLPFRRTNSATISAARSACPCAQRYSISTVRPSTQPSSRSRCTRAAVHLPPTKAVVGPRTPMIGSFARSDIGSGKRDSERFDRLAEMCENGFEGRTRMPQQIPSMAQLRITASARSFQSLTAARRFRVHAGPHREEGPCRSAPSAFLPLRP